MTTRVDEQGEMSDANAGTPFDLRVEGSGPPLLLVPGMDGTGRLFHRQTPGLARRFRVGTFRLPDDAQHMDTLIAAVTEVLRALAPDGERAVVCGESFGGAVAMTLAVRHPDLVRSIVVLNSFSRFLPQHRLHAAIAGVRLLPWGAMAIVRRLTAFRMHSRYTHHTELKRFLAETKATTKTGYVNRLRILLEYDMRPHLNAITMPALFIAADEDHLVPSVEQARYMVARVPHAELRILEGHGHICLIAPNVDLSRILGDWNGVDGFSG